MNPSQDKSTISRAPAANPSPGPAVTVIGAGPAGLMAAECLAQAGCAVAVYDAMPSVGRKFLLAGIGGLNLTHAEPLEPFLGRFGARRAALEPLLTAFDGTAVRAWAQGLGIGTFVGSSQRVFPADMKAAPLLRAWLQRLRQQGVQFHMRHRWQGFETDGALRFAAPMGPKVVHSAATVLALGGGSWPKLGSDGAWQPWLQERGVAVAPLQPSNCGFDVGWSVHLSERFAGQPLKNVAIRYAGPDGQSQVQAGEMVLTQGGLEGSLIYSASGPLRDRIAQEGQATLELDLLPQRSLEWVSAELAHPRGSRSFSTHLKSRLGLSGAKAALLHESLPGPELTAMAAQPALMAARIKALPITLRAARPLPEAISSAGGVQFEGLDAALMVKNLPGIFCAGEMLDWEAPTGGYLISACLASGRVAGQGASAWLRAQSAPLGGAVEAASAAQPTSATEAPGAG